MAELTRTLRGLIIVLAFATAAAACGSSTDTATETADTTTADETETNEVDSEVVEPADDLDTQEETGSEATGADDTYTSPDGTTRVRLLDQGAEPRQQVRLAPVDGTGRQISETTQFIEQTVDGQTFPSGPAVTTIIEEVFTVSRTDQGFEIITEVVDARAAEGTDAAIVELIEPTLTPMIGASLRQIKDELGITLVHEPLEFSDLEVAAALEASRSTGNVLVSDAVGVGAKWIVEQDTSLLGMSLTSVATHTLREFTDGGVIVDLEIEQVAGGIAEPIGGTGIIIEQMDVTGTGTIELRFDQISPARSEASTTVFQVMTTGGSRIEQTIETTTVVYGTSDLG